MSEACVTFPANGMTMVSQAPPKKVRRRLAGIHAARRLCEWRRCVAEDPALD